MISGVQSADVPRVWPAVVDLIKRATGRFDAGYDETHVLERLKRAEMQLWIVGEDSIQGVVITEVQIHPQFKVLGLSIVAGDKIDDWIEEADDLLTRFARHHDCKYLEGYGRKGWARKLKSRGFEEYSITIRRAL